MGLHLPPNATLDDMPIGAIQDTLTQHGEYVLKDHPIDPQARNKVYAINTKKWTQETHPAQLQHSKALISHGFAQTSQKDENTLHLTPTGEALMNAKLRERVPLEKADAAFERLKQGVEKLTKEGIHKVDEVWIYGSYQRREPSIGDIDVSVTTSLQMDIKDRKDAIETVCNNEQWYTNAKDKNFGVVSGQAYDETRVFGARRHPLLEDGQIGTYALRNLHTPVQRVYTHENGWVNEDPLEAHPSYTQPKRDHLLPRVPVTIDQGTFSPNNTSQHPPTREETLKNKIQSALPFSPAPQQEKIVPPKYKPIQSRE
jgi:hypothetical protein